MHYALNNEHDKAMAQLALALPKIPRFATVWFAALHVYYALDLVRPLPRVPHRGFDLIMKSALQSVGALHCQDRPSP